MLRPEARSRSPAGAGKVRPTVVKHTSGVLSTKPFAAVETFADRQVESESDPIEVDSQETPNCQGDLGEETVFAYQSQEILSALAETHLDSDDEMAEHKFDQLVLLMKGVVASNDALTGKIGTLNVKVDQHMEDQAVINVKTEERFVKFENEMKRFRGGGGVSSVNSAASTAASSPGSGKKEEMFTPKFMAVKGWVNWDGGKEAAMATKISLGAIKRKKFSEQFVLSLEIMLQPLT